MNQAEFLAVLRESLEGNIPQAELEENIIYYREYFESSDCSDTELCEQLGNPRLIAKSIIEAYLASKGAEAEQYTGKARSEYSRRHSAASGESGQNSVVGHVLHMLLQGIIGIGLLVGLILFLRVALVIIIPIAFVILIWKLIRGTL
ncbi:MAG: DUF1700 domain-containing protein [Lachnospiraceae bacterium]|nr:DUF1700 domain-containing protein [Lachnospiraceae bacterium]